MWRTKREQDVRQTPNDKIKQAREMVLVDRRVTIDEVASSLNSSHGFSYQIIHDELGFRKDFARWVPNKLTAEHKRPPAHGSPHLPSQKQVGFWGTGIPSLQPRSRSLDFYLFGPFKDALRGRRFSTDLDVQEAVQKWLHD